MTVIRILTFFMTLVLSLSGCKYVNKTNRNSKTYDGFEVYYYQNGNIKAIDRPVNNNLRRYTFYKNGNIKQILVIKNGIIYGDVYNYYPNGILQSKHEMIKDSVAVGSSWEYFKTGQIHKYRFYDKEGNLLYLRVYDILGNILIEEGSVVGDIIEKDTIIEGKTKLVIHPQLIHPPFCETYLSSIKILNKSKKINLLTKDTKDTTLYLDFDFSPFELEIVANLIDTIHKKTQKSLLKLRIKEHNK